MGENDAPASDTDAASQSDVKNSKKGGSRATLFIYLAMGLGNIGFVANMTSMVLYFYFVMHFDLLASATTTTNYLGSVFMLTLVGGFISDTYMNRLNTFLCFAVLELLGYVLMIIQSHYKKLQPEPCTNESRCVKGGEALMLYTSMCLLAIGAGGVRGSAPALGADQFDRKNPTERKYLARFFNWLLLSVTIGATIGVTIVVWVSMNKGWDKGFLIGMLCAFAGFIVIASGKPFYRIRVPGDSALSSIFQVLVVMVKNRNEKLRDNTNELYEIQDKESGLSDEVQIPHTEQFRLLDKAAILRIGVKPKKWGVCTVTQVEEVKILTRMTPIIISTVIMNTCLAQMQTVSVQQGTIMNTYIGSFEVPSASIPVIPLVFMSILIPIYEFAFVPLIRKVTGHPNGITHLQRVGVGLVLSVISMGIAGVVEVKRKHELLNNGHRISVFWLGIQYAIFGIADMFTLVGLMDFFYTEAPAGMRSLSTSFSLLSLSFGYFLSSIFVQVTNSVTGKITKSKRGWLEGRDMNKNHVELFYWFLAVLSVLNFLNYLYWAKWYNYKKDDQVMKPEKSLRGISDQSEEIPSTIDETVAMIQ
ncbi:NRT1/ PTR FAMILY 4.4 [Thalictrum thalictroides]|uniref:NRT1/ PTR FAMILY 4.4 n=1 Tax=Thalictrum thalictroides TaxID=46969 RepID=A0A7J6VW28_THATH|nr:NRT1/ PTR FAMILY 4.4 [Thalictrum thalictroides]